MRLIDADKLAKKSCAFGIKKSCTDCGMIRTITNPYTKQSISCNDIRYDFLIMIDNEKPVKAIPVKWLKTQIEKCQEISNTSKTVGLAILAETIKQWEKENETN